MMSELSHPAVKGVLAALPDGDLAVVAVAEREGVAAVVVQNGETRYVVLVERHQDEWRVPTMISGGGTPESAARPERTEAPVALQDRRIVLSGWPDVNGGRPEFAWCAVTGTAALDAQDVVIASEIDEVTAVVREDGFVLGVVRARWGTKPSVTVRTSDGRQVRHLQPCAHC